MEDAFVGVLLALSGALAFVLGRQMSPKNQTLANTAKWYESELANARTEINRYRSKAAYYQKGAVPSELGTVTDASGIIRGIIQALPPNLRDLARGWEKPLTTWMEANPQALGEVIQAVKGKIGGAQAEQGPQPL